jgi:hypothetical protein
MTDPNRITLELTREQAEVLERTVATAIRSHQLVATLTGDDTGLADIPALDAIVAQLREKTDEQ